MEKKTSIYLAVLVLVILGVVVALTLPNQSKATATETTTSVKAEVQKQVLTVAPQRDTRSLFVEEGTTLSPEESATVSAEITAVLKKWHVGENQRVKAGDPLATLEAIDYQITLANAEAGMAGLQAQYSAVEKNYERMKSLLESGSIPQAQFDGAEAEYKALKNQIKATEAALSLQRRRLANTTVRAPFDGVVTRKIAPLGKYIMSSMPGGGDICTMEKIDRLKATINLSESLFEEIDEKAELEFYIPVLNLTMKGSIDSKGKSINAMKQFTVISFLDNPDNRVPAGVYAVARLRSPERERVIVPPTAVRTTGNRMGEVLAIENGTVKAHVVAIGHPYEDGLEVKGDVPARIVKDVSNVQAGETVKELTEG